MDLKKLKQQAEELQKIDAANLSPEQLEEFLNKAMNLLEQSQQSLLNTSLTEIKEIENEPDSE